jgi:hypothetical protein
MHFTPIMPMVLAGLVAAFNLPSAVVRFGSKTDITMLGVVLESSCADVRFGS